MWKENMPTATLPDEMTSTWKASFINKINLEACDLENLNFIGYWIFGKHERFSRAFAYLFFIFIHLTTWCTNSFLGSRSVYIEESQENVFLSTGRWNDLIFGRPTIESKFKLSLYLLISAKYSILTDAIASL